MNKDNNNNNNKKWKLINKFYIIFVVQYCKKNLKIK